MDPDGRPGGQVRPDRGCRKEEDHGFAFGDQPADHPGIGQGQIFFQSRVIRQENPVRSIGQQLLGDRFDSVPQKEGHDFGPSPCQGKLLRRGQQLKGHLGRASLFLLTKPNSFPFEAPPTGIR
jgi:hypothetical protein